MKNEYNLLILKALTFFIDNPHEQIHLRGFARKTKISSNSAQRFLNLFLKQEFIQEERKANLRYFKANLDNLVFRYIKKTGSIKKITDSGLVKHLQNLNFSFVVLFGSIARGEDDVKSDIDLVCIGGKQQNLSEFERKLNREINAHFFSWAEWKKQAQQNKGFYSDVISQGINLLGNMPIAE